MRKCFRAMALCLSVLVVCQVLLAGPDPTVVPFSRDAWQLKFRFEDPQRVSVVVPGRDAPVVYWYMLYQIENPSHQELEFYPEFELVTDTLKVVRSEIRVSPEAFRAIQRRSGDPLLLPPEQVTGRLMRGRDRGRHSVAIWSDFDLKAKGFSVYVSGLSSEVLRIRNPSFASDKPEDKTNRRYFTLRKTLAIPYLFPGSEGSRALSTPVRVPERQEWIMR